MFAILAALGLRGLAPEMYEEREDDRWRKLWGYSFIVGSTVTPFLLGPFLMNWLLGSTGLITSVGLLGGLTVLLLTVVDGAAFLGLKTRGALRDDVSRYGIRAAVGYLGTASLTLGAVYWIEPGLRASFRSPIVVALVILTATLTGIYVLAIRRQRYYLAFVTTAGLVFGLVGLISILMFPFVDRTSALTIRDAIVSPLPLNLMSIMASVLIPIVLGYFVVLYSAFSGPVETEETYG
jgi:cytochrome d ubiquinol oxidase subunit II